MIAQEDILEGYIEVVSNNKVVDLDEALEELCKSDRQIKLEELDRKAVTILRLIELQKEVEAKKIAYEEALVDYHRQVLEAADPNMETQENEEEWF